jgi:hypothetical protein
MKFYTYRYIPSGSKDIAVYLQAKINSAVEMLTHNALGKLPWLIQGQLYGQLPGKFIHFRSQGKDKKRLTGCFVF